jgi:hypothetical protein
MKLAVFSESPADEAAIRILTEGLLDGPAELAAFHDVRSRGWPSVRKILPAVMKNLHYCGDADALVVVVDADRSTVHVAEHEKAEKPPEDCRLCQLRKVVESTRCNLRSVPNRTTARVALGLAVPSLEAWLLTGLGCGINILNEPGWIVAAQARKRPYDVRRLKEALYGKDRYDLDHETRRMTEEATRLAQDLARLEAAFPHGFGSLVRAVRTW